MFLLSVLLFSCSTYDPECGCTCSYTNLNYNVPYKQDDVIKFTDSIGNKLVFKLVKSKTYYHLITGRGKPDCGQWDFYKQNNTNFFEEENNKKRLFIGNYVNDGDTVFNFGYSLVIGIDSYNFSFNPYWLNKSKGYYPEITLNGKKYQHVYTPTNATWKDKQIYYVVDVGIVSFITDSVQWYLDN